MLRVVISMRKGVNKHKEIRDCLSDDWSNYLSRITHSLILCPLVNKPSLVTDFLQFIRPHVLILTNGEDLHLDKKRDLTEFKAIEFALNKNIPILGVCRGMQVLNYFFDGAIQNRLVGHVTENHKIEIVSETTANDMGQDYLNVNSFHNQGVHISDIAKCFDVLAVKDGFVELMHHKTKKILGMQWHPERKNLDQELTDLLIKKFLLTTRKEIKN